MEKNMKSFKGCLETVLENNFLFFKSENKFLTSKNMFDKICSENGGKLLEKKFEVFLGVFCRVLYKQLETWKIGQELLHHACVNSVFIKNMPKKLFSIFEFSKLNFVLENNL